MSYRGTPCTLLHFIGSLNLTHLNRQLMDLLQKNQPFAERIASQFVGRRLRTCAVMLANLLNG